MVSLRFRWIVVVLLSTSALASAQYPYPQPQPQPGPRVQPVASVSVPPAIARKPTLLDFVAESHREQVSQVLKAPTMIAKASDEEFVAHSKVYDWLVEHPDRTALAWQRMQVPCVDITDLGKGQFYWTDENGSELTWQSVGRFENGMIWYATGKVKAGAVLPTVPVRAVAVLHAPRSAEEKPGSALFKPTISVYILSDSRLATVALRVMGSSAPKMAEQGAEQLMFFFSGVARYLHKRPEHIEAALAPPKKK